MCDFGEKEKHPFLFLVVCKICFCLLFCLKVSIYTPLKNTGITFW